VLAFSFNQSPKWLLWVVVKIGLSARLSDQIVVNDRGLFGWEVSALFGY
jgi:hypothetical protein